VKTITAAIYATLVLVGSIARLLGRRPTTDYREAPREALPQVAAAGLSDHTLYSTFSAVAQTLAAVLAILITIVVIRLPALEDAAATADLLMRHFDPFRGDYANARKAFERNGVMGLQGAKFELDANDPNVGGRLEAGYRAWKARRTLIPAIWIALVPTFVVIASCLVALPAVPCLAARSRFTRGLVFTVVGLAIGCLVAYGWLIARLLGSRG
jgi:hypothetical protein